MLTPQLAVFSGRWVWFAANAVPAGRNVQALNPQEVTNDRPQSQKRAPDQLALLGSVGVLNGFKRFVRLQVRGIAARNPWLNEAKDRALRRWRRMTRTPFERDFEVLRHIRVGPGQVLVDVGANRGQSVDAMRLFHPEARIVSYEANPVLNERLRVMFADDKQVTIAGRGLGDQAGSFVLFVPVYRGVVLDGIASLDRKTAETWLTPRRLPGYDSSRLEIKELGCTVGRLDDDGLAPAFVKLDVQGFEAQVIEGGRETLAKHSPILLIEHDADPPALLAELGYHEYSYDGGKMRPVTGQSNRTANSFHVTAAHVSSLTEAGLSFHVSAPKSLGSGP